MVGRKYTYTTDLKDYMGGKLNRLATKGSEVYGKLSAGQKMYNQHVRQGTKNLGHQKGMIMEMVKGYVLMQATMTAINSVGSFFRLGSEMEQTRIAYQTLIQDVDKGNKIFDAITEKANVTPFTTSEFLTGGKKLKAYNIETENLLSTLTMLGDVASGVGREKFGSLILAYGQVKSATRLTGMEARQFSEASVPIYDLIAKIAKTDVATVKDKLIPKGMVSFDMVKKGFEKLTSEGGMFFNMMERQSRTVGGKWSTMVGKFQTFIAKLSMSQGNVFTKILDKVIGFVDYFAANIDLVKAKLNSFVAMMVKVGKVVFALGKWFWKFRKIMLGLLKVTVVFFSVYKSWLLFLRARMFVLALYKGSVFIIVGLTKGWAVAQRALNMTLVANPIGMVVAAVAALGTAMYLLMQKTDKAKDAQLGLNMAQDDFQKKQNIKKINDFFVKGGLIETVTSKSGRYSYKALKSDAESINKVKSLIKTAGLEKLRSVRDALNIELTTLKRNLDVLNLSLKGENAFRKKAITGALVEKISLYKKIIGLSSGELKKYNTGGNYVDGNLLGENVKNGLTGITSGGSRPTNINITLGKFQENLIIHAENIKEGAEEMRDIIIQELNRVLNSANQMATQ